MQERTRRHSELGAEKYTRQRRKEACQRETAYQALAGQAEIELVFHTPETVSSWSARWSGTELRQYDLGEMFWRWSERFPSLASMDRWLMANQPFWSVMVESDALAKESPEPVRQLERWMVPNKLIHRSYALSGVTRCAGDCPGHHVPDRRNWCQKWWRPGSPHLNR